MGYNITKNYRWYNVPNEPTVLALFYFIEGIPFDMDFIEKEGNLDAVNEANKNKSIKADDFFRSSQYLIDEEAHPMLFLLELENPEKLPKDYV
jgi:hypothetical protein